MPQEPCGRRLRAGALLAALVVLSGVARIAAGAAPGVVRATLANG
jgi:hypothetical protein